MTRRLRAVARLVGDAFWEAYRWRDYGAALTDLQGAWGVLIERRARDQQT